MELEAALSVASEAARAGGAVIRESSGRPGRVSYKGDRDPVTEVDLASERAILQILRSRTPEWGILSEEGGGQASVSDYRWILDPLDGTVNYARGVGWSCVSLALEAEGRIVAGVVYGPWQDELFSAVRGGGASCNGRPIRVSATVELRGALVAFGAEPTTWTEAEAVRSIAAVGRAVEGLRSLNAGALDLAHVAAGRLDGFWEQAAKPWDSAAGSLLVREAGGQVTDHAGHPYEIDGPTIVASNGVIHPALLGALGARRAPEGRRPG